MIISFDIDNTLIPYSNEFEIEKRSFLAKLLKAECLRKGTIELFRQLEERKHYIWIYTTSFRSQYYLMKTFLAYGLKPSKIINGQLNQTILRQHGCTASKNPALFGVDVHVDDLEGLELEGKKYNFNTIIVKPDDEKWAEKILEEVKMIGG